MSGRRLGFPLKQELLDLIDRTEIEILLIVAEAVDARPVIVGDRLAEIATRLFNVLRRARRRPLTR